MQLESLGLTERLRLEGVLEVQQGPCVHTRWSLLPHGWSQMMSSGPAEVPLLRVAAMKKWGGGAWVLVTDLPAVVTLSQ